MSGHVHWMIEASIGDGQLDAFKALMAEMVVGTKGEPGTINYEWFLSADEGTCHLYERYVDSDATMVHMGTFGEKYAQRFLAILALTRFTVYGDPDDAVRGTLDKLGAAYMTEVGGFARYG